HALPRMTLAVRTGGDRAILLKSIRRELRAMDPNLPLGNVRTVDQLLDEAVAPRRLSMLLLACLAGLAVALGRLGVCAVIWCSVPPGGRHASTRPWRYDATDHMSILRSVELAGFDA